MPNLCCGDLSPNGFLGLIETHSWPEDSILMAFTPAEALFVKFAFDAHFFSQTEQGRIFSPKEELKWRFINKMIRIVYLGESLLETLLDFSVELEGLSPYKRQLLLWGERTETENEWLEQPVPHRFSYPIATDRFPRGRAVLVVEDWKDTSGIPRFSRYHSVIEVKGGK